MNGFDPFTPKPDAEGVFKIHTKTLPNLIFEYHHRSQEVWLVTFKHPVLLGFNPGVGNGTKLAENIPDTATAAWIARAFVAGYKHATDKGGSNRGKLGRPVEGGKGD